MLKLSCFSSIKLLAAIAVFGLSACTPTYDWREVRGTEAPFVILLPAKPATHARPIDLAGVPLTMTMTAAEVNGVTFAVGSAMLPDQAEPQAALDAMKTALIKNIGGTVRQERSSPVPGSRIPATDIEAVGNLNAEGGGQQRILYARFAEKDRRIYQAIVTGNEKTVTRDNVDTFFTSFKLN